MRFARDDESWHQGGMTALILTTHALLAGRSVPFGRGESSAIAKEAIDGPVRITHLGFAGDEQADPIHHGGPDKAVHLYPQEHYDFWRAWLGGHSLLDEPGAFGENIATSGATEDALCLGDRFALGSAVLEISHGRAPCWKIDHRFARKGITAQIVRNGRCGVYFRVVQEGEAQVGDAMTLTARPLPEWSIARVFALLIGGEGKHNGPGLRALAEMPVLAQAWRTKAQEMAARYGA